jgi:hypothetical protein
MLTSATPDAGDHETRILSDFVSLLLPILTPYQAVVYLLLLDRALGQDERLVRIGKRTIASALGKGSRGARGNYQHITEKLNDLASLGCITIADTNREGTLYFVREPRQVPAVREALVLPAPEASERNYYRDRALRRTLFERDGWVCRYCGGRVDEDTATLDHVVPVSRGGADVAENLATCCLLCNSIKAGRTLEQAAPQILSTLSNRRAASGAM